MCIPNSIELYVVLGWCVLVGLLSSCALLLAGAFIYASSVLSCPSAHEPLERGYCVVTRCYEAYHLDSAGVFLVDIAVLAESLLW